MFPLPKRLNTLVKSVILLVVLSPSYARTQRLTLEEAYQLAREHYPLLKQKQLLNESADNAITNLNKGKLPQLNLLAQATYQSAVTSIDIPLPGLKVDPLSKDQYKIVADVNQLIYDGGVIKQQQAMHVLNTRVENEKIEVDLFKLKERITQVYLNILLLNEQLRQLKLVRTDIENGMKRIQAQVDNGTAFRSNLNILKAELLKNEQQHIEIQTSRNGIIDILGIYINQSIGDSLLVEAPHLENSNDQQITRPELTVFSSQSKLLDQQYKILHARNLPKTNLFLQGGYGKPTLNFLQNKFDWFYIGGIRLNWSLNNFYTNKREKENIELSRKMIDLQKETFLLNTNTLLRQQRSEIEKLAALIITDREIINLRASIKDASKAQLDNGVITANDYLREVNAEDMARQALITHELQLLQAQLNYQNSLGK